MTKRALDLWSAAILASLAILLHFNARGITMRFKTAVDSGFFPELVTGLLFSVAALIAYNAYRQSPKAEPTPAPSIGLPFRVWGTFILLAGFVLLMPVIGFPLATMVFLVAQMYLLTPNGEHDLVRKVLIAVPLALLIYFVFSAGFGLVLPRGPF